MTVLTRLTDVVKRLGVLAWPTSSMTDERPEEAPMTTFTPLVGRQEIADAWATYCEQMKRGAEPFDRLNGWQGGNKMFTVYWHSAEGIWAALGTDHDNGRHWCGLGTQGPSLVRSLGQACQINPPIEGVNRRCAGLFVRDQEGCVYLAHSGRIGGGQPGMSMNGFIASYTDGQSISVVWPDGKVTGVFRIARVDADDVVPPLSAYSG